MKKKMLILFLLTILGCTKDRTVSNNSNLQEVNFAKEINLNLPMYNSLKFVSNPVLITDPGVGIKGIIVIKVSDSDYRAYEASCPNHAPSACSLMTISGVSCKCPCDNYEYNLFTGLANGASYPLKSYRVDISPTVIRVYN